MVFCGYDQRIAIFFVLTLIVTDASAASARHRCPDMIESKDVRMKRDLHLDLPSPGRSSFADVRGVVVCSIARGGFLSGCTSSITDARGPALSKQVSGWRVLSNNVRGCPVRGRKIRFRFRLEYTD